MNISTPAIRTYIDRRQKDGAGNGTSNRELAALKRMVSLTLEAEKLLRRPYIPHLAEDNVRSGFFGEVEFFGPPRSSAEISATCGSLRLHLRLAQE